MPWDAAGGSRSQGASWSVLDSATIPPADTVERWAHDLVTGDRLEAKLAPPPVPERWWDAPSPLRLSGPGRPAELEPVARTPRSVKPGALRDPRARARLLHTFLHHELQAAELFCWALLAFPETPRAFRRGLLAIARDELAHLALYRDLVERLGHRVGAFGVRDWFWERVPSVDSPAAFTALFGIGLEGANLEHAARWSELLDAAGDPEAAAVVARVGREEEAHVRFATTWFERFTGSLGFDAWREVLPSPLSPSVLRGRPIARDARLRAGLDAAFVDQLERWPDASGS